MMHWHEVTELEEKEGLTRAHSIIERIGENDLANIVKLFSEARNLVRENSREIAMVVLREQ